MSAFKRTTPTPHKPGASRASDGFATLTGDMMERQGATPPPLVDPSADAHVSPVAADEPKRLFGKRKSPENRSRRPAPRRLPQDLGSVTESPVGAHPCQTTDQSIQKVYTGPDRRNHHISPVIERRRSVPPRVKVSVRLEQHRHQRLKGAGVLLGRTHQDLITVALDNYLDILGVLKGEDG